MGQRGHGTSRGLEFFSREEDMTIINCEQDIIKNHRIVSAVKTVEFFSFRLSCIVLRSRWSNIIAQNVHAPSKEKSDDSKGRF